MDKEMLDTLLAAMADMKDPMNNGFAEVHAEFNKADARMDKIESKIERLSDQVDSLVDKLEAIALDVEIIKTTVKKQDYEINRLKKLCKWKGAVLSITLNNTKLTEAYYESFAERIWQRAVCMEKRRNRQQYEFYCRWKKGIANQCCVCIQRQQN